MDFEKIAEELTQYAELEGSELGEACELLVALSRHYEDYLTKDFIKVLRVEMFEQLENFKASSKIVERTETVSYNRTFKELEWLTALRGEEG